MAALALVEIAARSVQNLSSSSHSPNLPFLNLIFHLLNSHDADVQQAAFAALENLIIYGCGCFSMPV